MNYLSPVFLIFITVFFILYYLVPPRFRYIVLFIGSSYFYGYADAKLFFVLTGVTVISYIGGLVIEKKRTGKIYVLFFMSEIFVLLVFKYTEFVIENINSLIRRFSDYQLVSGRNILLPIGLSFMIFQACNYLTDVYREKIHAERNYLKFGAYIAFFPTVLSGPIQKARNLLPQISYPGQFDYEQAQKGVLLFIWGAFEKIMVANRLSVIHAGIVVDPTGHSSAELLFGAIGFSLYIYADFSAYSDMARGIGKLLGIDVGRNFNNPYLSRSTTEFWNRWHISLNEWFIENIYIPLGGNRKGTLRKYINILIIFFISGLWHGANWHFVFWGVLNGVLVVIGQMIRPHKDRLFDRIGIDKDSESIVLIERIITFCLITLTWVYFSSGVADSLRICRRILLFDHLSIFDPELLNIAGTAEATFFVFAATFVFVLVQCRRCDETSVYRLYNKQPFFIQCLLVALLLCVCVFGAYSTDANVNKAFLYFGF